jgi:hypothetical protein
MTSPGIRRSETECLPLDDSREDGLSPSQFRRVLNFIGERISRTVTRSELAREAGLGVGRFLSLALLAVVGLGGLLLSKQLFNPWLQ